jgi:DNA-directed RNA polymerase subunit F
MTAVQKTTPVATPAQNSNPSNLANVKPLEPSIVPTAQNSSTITIHEVLEMLNQGNQKKALFDDFSKKVQHVENFRQKYEGGTLRMLIMNSEDEEEVHVANVEIIMETLDRTILKGRDYLAKVEKELLSIF